MERRKLLGVALLALPMIAGGVVLATQSPKSEKQTQQVSEHGYICPATGEELPCPFCCPLNSGK
jgi:hypothetical protein